MITTYGFKEWIDPAIAFFKMHNGKTIVEIGSIRKKDNIEGDGYSTVAWALIAKQVYTIDNDRNSSLLTLSELKGYKNVIAITMDGADFLNSFREPIDLLYLDGMDCWMDGHQEFHLRCYQAAKKNLHEKSVILIDDTYCRLTGKGRLVIPEIEKDYKKIFEDKMTLFVNSDAVLLSSLINCDVNVTS